MNADSFEKLCDNNIALETNKIIFLSELKSNNSVTEDSAKKLVKTCLNKTIELDKEIATLQKQIKIIEKNLYYKELEKAFNKHYEQSRRCQ